ncbi:hypothetical protein [Flagellimonas profundi]|uniref:SprT-like domain-containing protein n=1 Tax=Flagellimonas profundi TaxID=2915620 RepID=A0ABS3FGT1_9FLAO|nr:hypothetical protein [Allomuricauda profundi]MBO0342127.1 hypothetical protein [Allomuricauda profundi]
MKQLRNLLPVMLLAILANQCTTEEVENSSRTDPKVETVGEEPALNIEEIEFESFEQEPFYNALNNHLEFEQVDGNASKRKKKRKFKISKKHVKKVEMESGDYTSYTFYMTDEDLRDPTILQNLMVVKRKGELEVYRFLYGGTEKGIFPKDYDMARNTTFEKLLDFDMDEMGALTGKTLCLYDQLDCNGGGDNDNAEVYCYNVEIYIDYACFGNGATGTHYHDSDCNCTDGYGSCSSPYTDYQSEMFCTSDSNSNGAAQEYVSENHLGGSDGGTNVSTAGNDILISATMMNSIPEGADPLAFKIGLNTASPEYDWFTDPKNSTFYERVGTFLETQGKSAATIAFCNAAIEARYNGGKVDFEEKIIYLLEDYPCQKNIIQDLIIICQPISELFQEIFVDNNRAQIVFKVENLPQLEGGNTRWIGNSDNTHLFEITLNSYRLENSTNLDVINTIVHEYTHAVLLYFFYASPSFDIDLNNPPSYAELVQQFSLHREIIGGNNSPSQHEYMANFVSDIAEICLAWSEQNNMDYDLDYLIEIAWGGMTDTETFNLLYPEGSNVRFNVIEAQTNEIFPNSTNNEVGVPPCD